MTHHYNRTKEYFAIAVFILILVLPHVTSAEERIPEGKLCSELPRFKTTVTSALSERGNKLGTLKDDRLKNLNAAWKSEEDSKEAERSVADQKRKEHFSTLLSNAKGDANKSAIQTFQTAVESAITIRRSAIDAAFTAYKAGVTSLLESKMKDVSTLKTNYAKSLETAFANVKVACSKSSGLLTLRSKMKSNLHDIENKYQSSKKSSIDVSTEMGALAKTRREAIEKAEAEFKSAIATASAELNLAR